MSPELLLLALLSGLPDGKTSMPLNLTIDKMGSSVIINIKIILHEKSIESDSVFSVPEGTDAK